MRKSLFLIFTFLSLTTFGQHLNCCETEKEVEFYLNGKWKLKNSDSKTIYYYSFKNGKGYLEYFKANDKEEGIFRTDNDAFVEIIKYENGFKIEYIYTFETMTLELKYLNSNKLILLRDGTEKEYYKIEE